MLSIWIIHRDPKARAAIARISGVGERAVLAAPTDRVLEGADAPTVVVLGLSGDFEVELDFVHRHAAKLAGCAWILLAEAGDVAEARRLFDTLPGRVLVYPPEARTLRRALRAAVQHRPADPLSARQGRAELQARFARWFGDLELPELMRALDPRLARVPVLIHGEPGTGRSLLARYVHTSAGRPEHALAQITCRDDTSAEDLLRQMHVGEPAVKGGGLTFYLEDVDRLPIALQRRLRDWIEFGLPDGGASRHGHRFMASAAGAHDLDTEPGLDPRLAETLSGLTLSLPPLRERTAHIPAFVSETAAAIARARGERPRRFGAEALARLAAYPWPGNLHELEAVVTRTLSFTRADPIEPIHLRFPADLEWLGEPVGRADLEPDLAPAAAGETERPAAAAPSPRHAHAPAAHPSHDADVERPTAFPRPSPASLTVPIAGEPIDDLADLDPGAARGHESDIDVGRVATLGTEPMSSDALDDALEATRFESMGHGAGAEEEDLFPDDDLEEIDEADESWLFETESASSDGDVLTAPMERPATAALIDEADEASIDLAGELFADVELIDETRPDVELEAATAREPGAELEAITELEPDRPGEAITELEPDTETETETEALTELEPDVEPEALTELEPDLHGEAIAELEPAPGRPLDARTGFEPEAVEPTELLPDVEPLAPPVRPLPEAGEGDATAATLAEEALPFDEPFEPRPEAPEPAAAGGGIDARLYELVGAIAHEVRNPLVSIRTFSELLPDHYDDPEFRSHFRELVVKDVQRIDRVVSRLQSLAEGQRKREPIDVARLLDRLLDERRPVIQSRRLLVLKELDHTQPLVLVDAEQVEDAISGLLDRAIEQASERGDVYLASKYNERGLAGRPSVRILIRHTNASAAASVRDRGGARVGVPSPDQAMLDLVLAKRLIESQGGDLSVDEAEAGESVIVVDLPSA